MPTASELPAAIDRVFAESQNDGFRLSEKIPADSANAKLMVPILTKVIDGRQEEHTIDRYGGESWEQASRILAGYGESIIEDLDIHLKNSPRRLKVVEKMIDNRIEFSGATPGYRIKTIEDSKGSRQETYTVQVPVTKQQTVMVDGKEVKRVVTVMQTEKRTRSVPLTRQVKVPINGSGQESKLVELLEKFESEPRSSGKEQTDGPAGSEEADEEKSE